MHRKFHFLECKIWFNSYGLWSKNLKTPNPVPDFNIMFLYNLRIIRHNLIDKL